MAQDRATVIDAFQESFRDLDEGECCARLATRLSTIEVKPSILVLNLRKCYLDYSHCWQVLDAALIKARQLAPDNACLVVQTNIYLGSESAIVCLFFQQSKELECDDSDEPDGVVGRLKQYCDDFQIIVRIEVFGSGGTDSRPGHVYSFGASLGE